MNEFSHVVLDWYVENQRDLPWRNTTPWGVFVSEFMLQQTPVTRVVPKWNEWMEKWPTPMALAAATPADAIRYWGRLGYPRRALRLYESARIISEKFSGQIPKSEFELRSLPGVGEYTAAAISAFAFNQESLVLDINIRRFFSRVLDGVDLEAKHVTNMERVARRQLIPERNAPTWAAATMEFGAVICTARAPKCGDCPLSNMCAWRAVGYPATKIEKKKIAWHGTDRQCRGTIVQALRQHESLTEVALKNLWNSDSQVEKALNSLISDGLISKNGKKRYSLPNALAI